MFFLSNIEENAGTKGETKAFPIEGTAIVKRSIESQSVSILLDTMRFVFAYHLVISNNTQVIC